MLILFAFNMLCYFAVNWVMFAVGRFFVGKSFKTTLSGKLVNVGNILQF